MSKHFTYRIDEKIIKAQLQAIRIPLSDDAWPWFDLHAGLEKPEPVKKLFRFDKEAALEKLRLHRRTFLMAAAFTGVLLLAGLLAAFFSPSGAARADKTRQVVALEVSRQVATRNAEAVTARTDEELPVRITPVRVPEPAAYTDIPAAVASQPAVKTKRPKPAATDAEETPAAIEPILMQQIPAGTEAELR